MSEDTLSGRWQITKSPTASPGCCIICGKAEHPEGFVDGRMDFEFYGSVYFCFDCAREIGRVAGCLDIAQTANLKGQVENLLNQNKEYLTELDTMRGLQSAINSYVGNVGTVSSSPSDSPDVPPPTQAEPVVTDNYTRGTSGEESAPVTSNEPGPYDPPSIDESLNPVI